MQTFLPYADFEKTAKNLDYRRLGKQRVECLQILNVLCGKSKGSGWKNHPAVRMWCGYEQALVSYGIAICNEWRARGYKDTCLEKIHGFRPPPSNCECIDLPMPKWFGNKSFHRSHQSNLIRKYPEYYLPIFGKVPNNLPYIWP